MKGFKKIIALVATCVAATAAFALPPIPTGWYIDTNIGSTRVTGVTYAAGNSISSSGRGFNINGGYKFIPYFGAEIGYTKYANAIAKVNGVKVAEDSHYSYDIAAKGILPISDSGAELFAKLGLAKLNSTVKVQNQSYVTANGIVVNSGKHSATGLYYGLGASYTLWQVLSAHVSWQRAKGDSKTGNYDLYSIGLNYLFG